VYTYGVYIIEDLCARVYHIGFIIKENPISNWKYILLKNIILAKNLFETAKNADRIPNGHRVVYLRSIDINWFRIDWLRIDRTDHWMDRTDIASFGRTDVEPWSASEQQWPIDAANAIGMSILGRKMGSTLSYYTSLCLYRASSHQLVETNTEQVGVSIAEGRKAIDSDKEIQNETPRKKKLQFRP